MRKCVEELEFHGQCITRYCPHFIRTRKTSCALLGRGFIASPERLKNAQPQRFCIIKSGTSLNVVFDEENFNKYISKK